MPFTDIPFRTDFTPGDLIYGLSDPRAVWVMKHGAAQGKNWIDKFLVDMDKVAIDDVANIEFIQTTLLHPKYHSVMQAPNHPRTTESQQHMWRTKSKAGLNWAVTTGRHVHFILDNLDMKAVAEKSNTKGNPDSPIGKAAATVSLKDKVRTITNAELRWVFRNKGDPAVQAQIQFWLENKPCCPPWEPGWDKVKPVRSPGHTAWDAYHPTH